MTFFRFYEKNSNIRYYDGFDYTDIEFMEETGKMFLDKGKFGENIATITDGMVLSVEFSRFIIDMSQPFVNGVLHIGDTLMNFYNRFFGESDFYEKPLIPGESIDIPLNPFRKSFYRYWFKRDRTPGVDAGVKFRVVDYGI